MRTNTLNNFVLVIGKYDISLWIKLENQMICESLTTKTHNNDTLYSNLSDWLKSFWAQMSTKTHSKSWRNSFFIRFLLCKMKSHSIFYKQLIFVFRPSCFDNIRGGIDVIYVRDSQSDEALHFCNHSCNVKWSKTNFCFNFLCFVDFGWLLFFHYKRLYSTLWKII
jgi:hypothetical protein